MWDTICDLSPVRRSRSRLVESVIRRGTDMTKTRFREHQFAQPAARHGRAHRRGLAVLVLSADRKDALGQLDVLWTPAMKFFFRAR